MNMLHNYRTSATYATMIEANMIDKARYYARLSGGKIKGANPLWFITKNDLPECNGVVQAIFTDVDIDEQIDQIVSAFKQDKLPFSWWVGPSTQPSNLGAFLQGHGLIHKLDILGMAIELDFLFENNDLLPSKEELHFERVEDEKTFEEWLTFLHNNNSNPKTCMQLQNLEFRKISFLPDSLWQHFIGRKHGKVVAISSLFYGADVPNLYHAIAHPQHLHDSLEAAIILKTFETAFNNNYHVGTIQTAQPDNLRFYQQLGFETHCKIGIYQYDPLVTN
jgi:hypothetical protein